MALQQGHPVGQSFVGYAHHSRLEPPQPNHFLGQSIYRRRVVCQSYPIPYPRGLPVLSPRALNGELPKTLSLSSRIPGPPVDFLGSGLGHIYLLLMHLNLGLQIDTDQWPFWRTPLTIVIIGLGMGCLLRGCRPCRCYPPTGMSQEVGLVS